MNFMIDWVVMVVGILELFYFVVNMLFLFFEVQFLLLEEILVIYLELGID